MPMKSQLSARARLKRKWRRGFRGHPLVTIAYYGPDNLRASKIAVGLIRRQNEEPAFMRKWFADDHDLRDDEAVHQEVLKLVASNQAKTVAMIDQIIGCPHEEGIDYAMGEPCPQCPYWANRPRRPHEK